MDIQKLIQLMRMLLKDTGAAASARGGYRFLPSSNPVDVRAANALAKKIPNSVNPELRELMPYTYPLYDPPQNMKPGSDLTRSGVFLPSEYGRFVPSEQIRDIPPAELQSFFPGQLDGWQAIRRNEVPWKPLQRNDPKLPLFDNPDLEDGYAKLAKDKAEAGQASGNYFHRDKDGPLKLPPMTDMGDYQIDPELVKQLNRIFRSNIAPER